MKTFCLLLVLFYTSLCLYFSLHSSLSLSHSHSFSLPLSVSLPVSFSLPVSLSFTLYLSLYLQLFSSMLYLVWHATIPRYNLEIFCISLFNWFFVPFLLYDVTYLPHLFSISPRNISCILIFDRWSCLSSYLIRQRNMVTFLLMVCDWP